MKLKVIEKRVGKKKKNIENDQEKEEKEEQKIKEDRIE